MKLGKLLFSGIFWNTIGTFAVQGGTFVSNLIIANLIGVTAFGQFSFIMGTTQMIAATLQLATGSVTTKFLAEYRNVDKGRASLVLGLCQRITLVGGALGTLIMLILASGVIDRIFDTSSLNWYFVLCAPSVFFILFSTFNLAGMAGLQEFRRSAVALVVLTFIMISSAALAGREFGLMGALAALTASLGLRAGVTYVIFKRAALGDALQPRVRLDGFSRDVLVKFIVPAALSGFTAAPALWFAGVSLTRLPGSFEQIALLNVALVIRSALIIFPTIVSGVCLSILSASRQEGLRRHYNFVLLASVGISSIVALVSVAIIFIFGHQILALYGRAFTAALPLLEVFSISLVFEAMSLPLQQALLSKGHIWRTFVFALLPRDLVVAVLSYLFVVQHGAIGIAYAHVIAWLICLLATSIMLLRYK